ncbi:MAG TPA: A/G-specific adenine glycosylase [Usitatibacter sp.]|jgi:A/G-specific adenine glycosylase|nr:A/G-specific adenine glycosylase [Usitatibacter sp.]
MPRAPARAAFSVRVVRWQREHGRSNLPWQATRDAYRIWLSEIMLQQTQVSTVIPYFERFVARFPDAASLAAASEDDVMALWSGLGYYARARNLHRAAREVVERFGGVFPSTFDALATLPGIGRSTASAIAAFASAEPRPILDGNVRRVLARHGGLAGDPASTAVRQALWREAEARMTRRDVEAYTQGMMDLGATVCLPRKPLCLLCPVNEDCVARLEDRIAELPGRKVRAPARRRRIAMLVVLAKGEVLLEKRPARGIWGGLWSLPEAHADARPEDALRSDWGLEAARVEALQPFQHAFTHFTLEVTPWRIEPRRPHALAESKPATWMPLADLAGAALPSPVRKLLLNLWNTDEHG